RFGKVPVLYFPYILWPATTERSSGWLIPKPSYSDRRGFHVGLAYYRTLGRSADATFYADLSTKEYQGLGFEYRYTPTENTQGIFESYYLFEPVDQDVPFPIRDPTRSLGEDRWKVAWTHESKNLWGDWRGVINLELFSDFDYERDIDRTFDRQTRPFQYSNAFLTSNRGNQSWNVMVDQQIRLDNVGTRATLRQLPEIEYQVRSTRLGSSNVYFDLRSSVNYFFAEFEDRDIQNDDGTTTPGDRVSFDYGRLDLAPSLSVPLSNLTWLSAKLTVAGRVTHYTDSLADPEEPDQLASDEPLPGGSLTRVFPSAALEIVGPSVSKIFETDGKRFSKYKHIIEPRINYVWVDQYDDANRISIFDGIDRFFPQNGVVVSIVNRLLAKPRDEEKGGAFEIASFELAQGYIFDDFDEDPTNDDSDGPLVASLRYNPSDVTSLRAEAVYDSDISQLTSFRLSGGVQVSENFGFGLSYSALWNDMGDETKDQVRFSTQIGLGDRLTLGLEGSYDNLDFNQVAFPDRERWLNRRLVLDYQAECLSWLLEYRETTLGFQPLDAADQKFDDSEIRFSLTLKNVGTFLDINESF
ncbi:MAG: LPS assembly protein LptD, partial [Acidobacteriota bacterium]